MSTLKNPNIALLLPIALAASACARRHVDAPIPVLDVCELSRDFHRFDGRRITVRGICYQGLRERCGQNCMTGEPWPAALDLVEGLSSDHNSWNALDRMAMLVARQGRRATIRVTVTGRLRAEAQSPVGPCDRVGGGNYGHLGTFPAELVVEQIGSVLVRDEPSSGYDYGLLLHPRAL